MGTGSTGYKITNALQNSLQRIFFQIDFHFMHSYDTSIFQSKNKRILIASIEPNESFKISYFQFLLRANVSPQRHSSDARVVRTSSCFSVLAFQNEGPSLLSRWESLGCPLDGKQPHKATAINPRVEAHTNSEKLKKPIEVVPLE